MKKLLSLCLLLQITPGRAEGGVVVKEDSDAVLPCSLSTKENIETKLFDWKKDDHKEVFHYDGGDYYGNGLSGQDKQFEGRVSHFNDELRNGNASINIRKTKVSDSGVYTCEFPRLRQEFLIELVVECILKDRTKEEPGACSEPSVTILKQSKTWSLLQCEVYGASPRPEVEWRNSSGNILNAEEPQVTERGGSYDIILNTTVTKTDNYSCVLTQNEICHQTVSNTFVRIHDPEELIQGFSAGSIVTAVVITLSVVVFVLAVLFATGHISCREGFSAGWIVAASAAVAAVFITLIGVIVLAALFVRVRKVSGFSAGLIVVAVAVVITLIVVVIVQAVRIATGRISCREGFLMKRCRHDDMRNKGDVTSDHLEESI